MKPASCIGDKYFINQNSNPHPVAVLVMEVYIMEKTEERKIDLSKLETGLESLTGRDYESAERMARMQGDATPMIQYSSSFQAALAATALGVTNAELKELPIKMYAKVIGRVTSFLFEDSVKEILGKMEER